MKNEHRTETREQIAVPVWLADGATGTTRNLSASGLFFETGAARQVGSQIELSIDLGIDGRPLFFRGRGQVLRVAPLGIGVLVAINDVGYVAVALDDPQGRPPSVTGIGAQVLAAPRAGQLALYG
jgi:hypothetical protein